MASGSYDPFVWCCFSRWMWSEFWTHLVEVCLFVWRPGCRYPGIVSLSRATLLWCIAMNDKRDYDFWTYTHIHKHIHKKGTLYLTYSTIEPHIEQLQNTALDHFCRLNTLNLPPFIFLILICKGKILQTNQPFVICLEPKVSLLYSTS